jgi:hypothetical protein
MQRTIFLRRLLKERLCEGIRNPKAPILSRNPKTGLSLNLPVRNCWPTPACSENCYACQGPSVFPAALEKAIAVDQWIRNRPHWAALKTIREARGAPLRLSGSGDMAPDHAPYLTALLWRSTRVYGFTKRPDTWRLFSRIGVRLMFSVDTTMDSRRLSWAFETVPKQRLAYCRRPHDPDWSHRVAVTLPEHGPLTHNAEKVPVSETDCPAIRYHSLCAECRRCF